MRGPSAQENENISETKFAGHFWFIGTVNNLSKFWMFLLFTYMCHATIFGSMQDWYVPLKYRNCIYPSFVIFFLSCTLIFICLNYLYIGLLSNFNFIRFFLIFIALSWFASRNKTRHWNIHKGKKALQPQQWYYVINQLLLRSNNCLICQ